MPWRSLALFACASLALAVASTPAVANPSGCASDPPPPASPRIVHASLDGLDFNVVLPPDYATAARRRYPVLFYLHGADYNENTFLDHTDLEQFTARYSGDDGVIVVTPDGGPMGFYRDWFDGSEQWERYHLERLVPYVDEHFRTIADRAHRAVAGFSMGGYGAMLYAARRPDLFGVAASFSGIVHLTLPEMPYQGASADGARTDAGAPAAPQNGRPRAAYKPPDDDRSGCNGGGSSSGDRVQDAIDWHNHDPTELASNLRDVRLYLSAGNGVPCPDDATAPPSLLISVEPGILKMTQDFDSALSAADVRHTTELSPCGVHNLQSSQRHLAAFWPQMLEAFAHPPPDPARFDLRTADRDFSVWGWAFHADPNRAAEFLEVREASRAGVLLTGSGTETVVTAPLFEPGQRVAVRGALPALATAGPGGRLTVAVDLGAPHTDEQFDPGVPAPSFVSRRVTFQALAAPRPGGRARAAGRAELPRRRSCARASRLTIRLLHRGRLRSLTVNVNARRRYARSRSPFPRRLTLRRLPRGRATVRVVARSRGGAVRIAQRRYRACRSGPAFAG